MHSSLTETSGDPVIEAVNLGKQVTTSEGVLEILSSVDLIIKPADTVAIMGTSGSGKSTLLSLLAALDEPTSGSVSLFGHPLAQLDEEGRAELRNLSIGFVFQSFQLLPGLTALENVMLPLELCGDKKAAETAQTLLERVGLANRTHHTPRQLSGGEQQRVALARAFVTKPGILFADEPTGNLDSRTGEQIIELLFELNREKQTTLVLVTHDEPLAARCHRTVRLESGKVVCQS